ncbi:MAG: hypothetical protein A3I09_01075 [Deltaproteobacteria bacterium RIFCSPLOWO2_02_FULL_47_10]|nr:MAG: hypothetical protein A3I09_01075 [Deltaproteobacteria bacterium RIFCSPLOWO2_02_FULL_47_10]
MIRLGTAKHLDRFYIPTRYPNGLPGGVPFKHFSKGDFKTAVSDGETIMTECQKFLKLKGVKFE